MPYYYVSGVSTSYYPNMAAVRANVASIRRLHSTNVASTRIAKLGRNPDLPKPIRATKSGRVLCPHSGLSTHHFMRSAICPACGKRFSDIAVFPKHYITTADQRVKLQHYNNTVASHWDGLK